MHFKTHYQAQSLLAAMKIAEDVSTTSAIMTDEERAIALGLGAYSREVIEIGLKKGQGLTQYALKSLESELFKFWNEYLSEDTEKFWEEVTKQQLPFQRKHPLRELLDKGRLRFTEQWIALYNNFSQLENSLLLKKQFSMDEIKKIKEILEAEKQKRLNMVSKCFQKKKIPYSQYLQFGESMAFLENCNLTLKYFTPEQRDEIYAIWKSA
jgi:hypothetical protein